MGLKHCTWAYVCSCSGENEPEPAGNRQDWTEQDGYEVIWPSGSRTEIRQFDTAFLCPASNISVAAGKGAPRPPPGRKNDPDDRSATG
jgi:hypothetical protein